MADIKQIYKSISTANLEYKSAVSQNLGLAAARERLKNILFTHRDVILSVFAEQDDLQKKLEDVMDCRDVLSAELDDVDRENDELKKEIKKLKSELEAQTDHQQEAAPRRKKKMNTMDEERKVMTAVVE